MNKRVYIYALHEDGSDEVRYVGQTSDPEGRLKHHLHCYNLKDTNPKKQWINDAQSRGSEIALDVIEEWFQSRDWVDEH